MYQNYFVINNDVGVVPLVTVVVYDFLFLNGSLSFVFVPDVSCVQCVVVIYCCDFLLGTYAFDY